MCWRADSRDVGASQAVRRSIVDYLTRHVEETHALPEAELAIGELLGNVARHSPGPFCAEVLWQSDRRPTVTIHDGGECFVVEAPDPDDYAEAGRGIALVRALVDEIDTKSLSPEGCVVIATLALHRKPSIEPEASPCPFFQLQPHPMCLRPGELRRRGATQGLGIGNFQSERTP